MERLRPLTASAVIITTGNDDTNIYLTIYCRKLHPDIQIIIAVMRPGGDPLTNAGRLRSDNVLPHASPRGR